MLNYEEFAGMFGMWADIFKPFIESKEMFEIYQRLKEDAQKDVIVPSSDVTFRSFAVSNPDQIKVVWYLMDPYPRRYRNRANQATGIPMDCSNTPDGKLQPSLEIFYNAIDKSLGMEVDRSPDISYLLKQGVLLLNTDLTCKLNKTSSHERLWEPFQKFLLEYLYSRPNMIYILSGKTSERMEKFINPLGNHIIKTEHPAAASHKNSDWNHRGVFSSVDRILKQTNNGKIYWNKRDWDKQNEAPF